jgi:hypothetical protein
LPLAFLLSCLEAMNVAVADSINCKDCPPFTLPELLVFYHPYLRNEAHW